jgi:hypothetical protein
MRRNHLFGVVLAAFGALASASADASITFTFDDSGPVVTMTSSGVLDTTLLVSVSRPDGWGLAGTEDNPIAGDIDIMGGTTVGGPIDAQFEFSAGTDASAISFPGGPFAFDSFPGPTVVGTRAFTTYSGFSGIGSLKVPGIGITRTDMVGGLWTPDQNWTYGAGDTFATLGLIPGTYTVADALTGESITIQIGRRDPGIVPEGTTFAMWGGLAAIGLVIRRRRAAK